MKLTQAVAKALSESGGRPHLWTTGRWQLLVANELATRGAKFVASRNETGAVTMAHAYARVSGRPGEWTSSSAICRNGGWHGQPKPDQDKACPHSPSKPASFSISWASGPVR